MTFTPSPEDITDALRLPTDFTFDIPDPEDESLSEQDFLEQIDAIWKVCDRFDLQTDIWRGRILRAVRDREKKGGENRGAGFSNWLKQRDITKSQAYVLIQLATSADELLASGTLNAVSLKRFSKSAFMETVKADPEVQRLVSEVVDKGERITRREVRQLADEWTAINSDLLPEEVREKANQGSLPARHLAPLVKELEKLPNVHLTNLQEEVAANPDVDTVKYLTSEARSLSKYLDAAAQVQTLRKANIDIERALDEALNLDCLSTAADLMRQATQLEQTVAKLYTTWKRLGSLADRLYVDTGASSPHLRSLISCLERLSQDQIEVELDDEGTKMVRLKLNSDTGS